MKEQLLQHTLGPSNSRRMLREAVHYGIHLLLPLAIGILGYPGRRMQAVLILYSGLLIDLDHFLADPVFDPDRCSIGFHPLHSFPAIGLYAVLLFSRRTRIFGIALLVHILADSMDCALLTSGF